MAYVPTDPNALDQNQNPAQPAPGAQAMVGPQTSSGGASSSQAGTGSAVAPGSPQGVAAVPGSTQAPPVQDLHAYLDANQPQAVQMGKNIAGNLDQTRNAAVGDINSAQTGVDQTIQNQNVAPDAALVSRAAADPTNFVKNAGDLTKFQAQRDASYGGPTSFEGTAEYGKANKSVQDALSKAPDINQSQGVEQLARGQEQNPTAGMSNLDALLLQGTPDSMAPIKSSIAGFKDLPGQLTAAGAKENAAIKGAQDNATAAAGGVKDAFLTGPNAVVPAWEQALAAELPAAQKGATDYNDAVAKIIQEQNGMNPSLNAAKGAFQTLQDTRSSIGLTPEVMNQLRASQGLPPLPTLDFSTLTKTPDALVGAPTQETVATAQDYAMEQALQQLLGGGFGPAPLDPAHAGQAGTWNQPATPTLPVGDFEAQLQQILDANNPPPGSITNTGADVTPGSIPDLINKSIAAHTSGQSLMDYLKGLK